VFYYRGLGSKYEELHANEEENDGANDDRRHVLAEPECHLHVLGTLPQVLAAVAQD